MSLEIFMWNGLVLFFCFLLALSDHPFLAFLLALIFAR